MEWSLYKKRKNNIYQGGQEDAGQGGRPQTFVDGWAPGIVALRFAIPSQFNIGFIGFLEFLLDFLDRPINPITIQ